MAGISQTTSAAAAFRQAVRPTTFIESARLSQTLAANVTVASETFQVTGSFKFRAAYCLAASSPEQDIIAASSGNFGQALAYACKLLGKQATIVMPETSAQVKIQAVRDFGGIVELVDTKVVQRAERVRQLAEANPNARIASAYDDDLVIAGNSSLGEEIAAYKHFDFVIVPVGGGGLISGIIQGLNRQASPQPTSAPVVIGAEPQLANDASLSLQSGELISQQTEQPTIADGARTLSLGKRNWAIVKDAVQEILEVDERQIGDAVRLLFSHANLKAEPTGALTIGAMLANPEKFVGKNICCVVSGGNVDPAVYAALLAGKNS